MPRIRRDLCALLLLLLTATAEARDNKGFQANRFRPTLDPYGIHGTDSPEVLAPYAFSAGLLYDHSKNPVEFGRASDSRIEDLIRQIDIWHATLAVGLPYRVQLGLTVPYAGNENGKTLRNRSEALDESGFLDMRFEGKWMAYTNEERTFALGLQGTFTLPTGRPSMFRGEDDQYTAAGLVVMGYRAARFRANLELGYEWVEESIRVLNARIDDRFLYGLGAEYAIWRGFDGEEPEAEKDGKGGEERGSREERIARRKPDADPPTAYEVALQVSVDGSLRAEKLREEVTNPIELLYGASLRCSQGFSITVGGGSGLSNGIGAPDFRFFVGLSYTFGGPMNLSGLFGSNADYDKPPR